MVNKEHPTAIQTHDALGTVAGYGTIVSSHAANLHGSKQAEAHFLWGAEMRKFHTFNVN